MTGTQALIVTWPKFSTLRSLLGWITWWVARSDDYSPSIVIITCQVINFQDLGKLHSEQVIWWLFVTGDDSSLEIIATVKKVNLQDILTNTQDGSPIELFALTMICCQSFCEEFSGFLCLDWNRVLGTFPLKHLLVNED